MSTATKNDMGTRMKFNYERASSRYLIRRMPVIVRVDGKSFHSVLSGAQKPFDIEFIDRFTNVIYQVKKEIQGFKMAYMQSDEVSFLLTDYDDIQTQGWFGYKQSKIETITAALVSAGMSYEYRSTPLAKRMVFDARAFNVPREDVVNYFLWRYRDWYKNSTHMAARMHFSERQLTGVTTSEKQRMLADIGHSWTDYSEVIRSGRFFFRQNITSEGGLTFATMDQFIRHNLRVDYNFEL